MWTAGTSPHPLIARSAVRARPRPHRRRRDAGGARLARTSGRSAIAPSCPIGGPESRIRRRRSTRSAKRARSRAQHRRVDAWTAARRAFDFRTIGQLAAIGRRTGVARVFGVNFSGFFAWWLWRTIYLSKLPRFEKKVRVAIDWTLDLIFAKDFVQFLTVRAPVMSMRSETRRVEQEAVVR